MSSAIAASNGASAWTDWPVPTRALGPTSAMRRSSLAAAPTSPSEYGTEPAAWEAAPYVTQEMMDAFGVTGTPDQCLQKLERYYQAGINLPLIMPLGCNVSLALELGKTLVQRT